MSPLYPYQTHPQSSSKPSFPFYSPSLKPSVSQASFPLNCSFISFLFSFSFSSFSLHTFFYSIFSCFSNSVSPPLAPLLLTPHPCDPLKLISPPPTLLLLCLSSPSISSSYSLLLVLLFSLLPSLTSSSSLDMSFTRILLGVCNRFNACLDPP